MGFPLLFIEIIITLLGLPISIGMYYYRFRNYLKDQYTTKQLFRHIFKVIGIVLLAIFIANLIRYSIGMLLIYLYEDSFMNNLGHLLWFTSHEQPYHIVNIVLTLNVLITFIIIYLSIRYISTEFNKEIPRYILWTTLFFNFPMFCWFLHQILVTI